MEWIDNQIFLDNPLWDWIKFVGVLLGVLILNPFISKLLGRLLFQIFRRMAPGKGKRFSKMLLRPIEIIVLLIAMSLAFHFIKVFPTQLDFNLYDVHFREFLQGFFALAVILAVTYLAVRVVDFVGEVSFDKALETDGTADDQLVLFLKDVMKVVIYIISIFLILGAVLQLNITSLLAGAGLAGLAIALAAQDSLQNLLGSLSIFSEKPFLVGDFIQINDIMGTVEKVGFRSTRIRTIDKTFVTLPNKMLMENPLNNLTDRTFRRVKSVIGVTYDTNNEQIKNIVSDLEKMIEAHPETSEDYVVGFHEFGASSQDILVIYNLKQVGWNDFVKLKEEINYGISEIVKKHGADFAFPSQTLYIENSGGES